MDRHDEIRQMCEAARQLVDELHRERLDYGEYLTIRDALDLAESEVENLTAENERLGAEVERVKAREALVPKLVDAAEYMFNARCYCQENELSMAVSKFWKLWDEWRAAAKGGGE